MAAAESEKRHHLRLDFSVQDTGIGVPEDKLSQIFERFTQADGSTTRQYGGSGLGTTISRHLVELMGGRIGASSQPGKGSTFWFTLDFPRAAQNNQVASGPDRLESRKQNRVRTATVANDEPGRDTDDQKRKRILLVEDYPTNQQVALAHLKAAGYRVDLAKNGRQAVEAVQESPYDLVLMDIQMPEMDGYTATEKIRTWEEIRHQKERHDDSAVEHQRQPREWRRLPIIAMTAHAMAGHSEKCLASGMDDFLSKPLKRDHLLATVGKWIENGVVGSQPEQAPAAHPVVSHGAPLDYDRALEEFMGEKGLLVEIMMGFQESVGKQIPLMHEAIAARDAETVHREAHAIKGGGGQSHGRHPGGGGRRTYSGRSQWRPGHGKACAGKIRNGIRTDESVRVIHRLTKQRGKHENPGCRR